jgi:hypothetical protein
MRRRENRYRREAWPQGRRKYRHGWGAAVRPKEYRAKAVQLIRARTQQASNNQQVLSQESDKRQAEWRSWPTRGQTLQASQEFSLSSSPSAVAANEGADIADKLILFLFSLHGKPNGGHGQQGRRHRRQANNFYFPAHH